MERERKFNILRGLVIGAFLRMEVKEELIDFVNELEEAEQEIRNKAIDEFIKRLYKIGEQREFDWEDIYKIADEMKGGMSMLIRSQDKGRITNFNLVSDLVVSKSNKHWKILACYPYFDESECGYSTLGTYSTEEKAIKVLDMIQEKYGTYMAIGNDFNGVQGYYNMPKVFQMPQYSEV